MDKTRTLPPRVRGKVTGVLGFFIDEIRFFRNILLLTDNFDLVLQVQWWGEVVPVFIRPKKLHVQGITSKNHNVVECYYHSAKYEIKTSLELFKSYLRNCEVLELSVLEAFENYVIGSAFLKDLISLFNNNNETIKMPIFDYLGEEIGEVYIHINYLEKAEQENRTNQNQKSELLKSSCLTKPDTFSNSNNMKSNFTLGEKTIVYDGLSKKNLKDHVISEFSINSCDFIKKNKISYSNLGLSVPDTSDILLKEQETNCKPAGGEKESISCKCLPKVNTLNDSSKILYFGKSSQQSGIKANVKKPNSKIINKFNSNSIKCKSKQVENSSFSNQKKLDLKKPECSKSLIKNFSEIGKQSSLKLSSPPEKFTKLESEPFFDLEGHKSVPTNKSPNSKVLNYLLGSDMSKDDEQAALNDFKKMSPSHTLVDSINHLCFTSDDSSQKTITKFRSNSPVSVKETYLNFDFTNPIERSYYEKFFLKSNSPDDFEVAELLNHPKNTTMLEKLKVEEFPHQNNMVESSSLKNSRKLFEGELKPEDFLGSVFSEKRNGCACCKYYKKLNELDTIIESLKHFEQKMLVHEKEMKSVYKC